MMTRACDQSLELFTYSNNNNHDDDDDDDSNNKLLIVDSMHLLLETIILN